MEDLVEKTDPTSESAQATETETVTEQDPLKQELERVQKKETRSELEKAAFSLKKTAERLKELGGDPVSALGIESKKETEPESDDDAPVTVGMLKKLQQETAHKSALQLADDIENETERELVKYHLENSIKSSGNPQEDVRLARTIVNAVKNKQIIEEQSRKIPAKTHSSASSAPAKVEQEVELTMEELAFMRPPFNMTKDEILKARPKA